MNVRQVIEAAVKRGWTYDGTTGRGHHRLRHPSGATVYPSASASDVRAANNLDAELRRIERAAAPAAEVDPDEDENDECPEPGCVLVVDHSCDHRIEHPA